MNRRSLYVLPVLLLTVVLLPPLLMGCYNRVALERYKALVRTTGHLKPLAEVPL
jgi:hypothetical protein